MSDTALCITLSCMIAAMTAQALLNAYQGRINKAINERINTLEKDE